MTSRQFPKNKRIGRADLVRLTAMRTDLSQAQVNDVIMKALDVITETMIAGGRVSINGFGAFESRLRAARTGFNPRLQQPIQVAEHRAPVFVASSALKKQVR